jgi:hypothetical protein
MFNLCPWNFQQSTPSNNCFLNLHIFTDYLAQYGFLNLLIFTDYLPQYCFLNLHIFTDYLPQYCFHNKTFFDIAEMIRLLPSEIEELRTLLTHHQTSQCRRDHTQYLNLLPLFHLFCSLLLLHMLYKLFKLWNISLNKKLFNIKINQGFITKNYFHNIKTKDIGVKSI